MTDPDPRLLGFIVGQEARRVFTGAEFEPDPARVADGWTRRFVTDITRLDEVRVLYLELGFDVEVDPVRTEQLAPDCEDCYLVALDQFVTVYTRPQSSLGSDKGGVA